MFWKKYKDLMIIGIIWIIVSILILIILCPEVGEMIQAEALITLVFVTIFYAKQTQNLVEQEKISLEDQKSKRRADYGEKKLKEFYNPLKYKIHKLKNTIIVQPNLIKPIILLYNDILKLGSEHEYFVKKENEEVIVELLNVLWEIKDINILNKEKVKVWKKKGLIEAEKVINIVKKEINIVKKEIDKVYGFDIDKKPEK
ncbi:MAG: hypothetical protein WBC20_06860 [Candidatus Aminicenantaceae bacterium]